MGKKTTTTKKIKILKTLGQETQGPPTWQGGPNPCGKELTTTHPQQMSQPRHPPLVMI